MHGYRMTPRVIPEAGKLVELMIEFVETFYARADRLCDFFGSIHCGCSTSDTHQNRPHPPT